MVGNVYSFRTQWSYVSEAGKGPRRDRRLFENPRRHRGIPWLHTSRQAEAAIVLAQVLAKFKGAELVGRRYAPLFPYFAHMKAGGAFRVLADPYVQSTGGTGVVHQAPAFGEDDNRVCMAHGARFLPSGGLWWRRACPYQSRGAVCMAQRGLKTASCADVVRTLGA